MHGQALRAQSTLQCHYGNRKAMHLATPTAEPTLSIVRVLSSVPPAYFKHFVACPYNYASSGCPRSYTTDSASCSWIHEKLAVPEKHADHFGLQATLRPASREGLVIQSFGSLLVRNPVPIASWATSGRQPAADLRLLLGNSQSPPVTCE